MVDFCIEQRSNKKFVVYADHKNDSGDTKELIEFINKIVVWCKKTFGNDYETWNFRPNGCVFNFEKEAEALAFKLRWM